jgi:hypothetical protein
VPPGPIYWNIYGPYLLCGDLNYRVDLSREITEFSVSQMSKIMEKPNNSEGLKRAEEIRLQLLCHDQLMASIAEERAFAGFSEGHIIFPLTFKYDKETNNYDTSHKQRIPAWTDRFIFKPNGTRVLEYNCVQNAKHSDHQPVYATFRVNMLSRELAPPTLGTKLPIM